MRDSFLSFSPPSIGEEEMAEVVDTLRSDWITTGPKVKLFEERFASLTGAPSGLAVNSCTAALHLSLLAFGVGPGDVVITTPMTFCSTVNVIEHVGARPLLVDVEPDTLNIDLAQARIAAEGVEGIKAIIAVHYAGHPVNQTALYDLAEEKGWAVIEDAAHAFPARHEGTMVGAQVRPNVRSTVCFSFYATKNLTTAEGGMLLGASGVVDEARVWALHGMSKDAWNRYDANSSWFYEVVHPGFKYNMTDIQAALGIQQLKKVESFIKRRRAIAARYTEAFSALPEIEPPSERRNVENAWHLYVIRLHLDALSIDRESFIEGLRRHKIGSSVHFIPIHMHPYYRDKYGYKPTDLPIAYAEYQRMLSLPIHPRLTDVDVEDVIEAVRAIVDDNRL